MRSAESKSHDVSWTVPVDVADIGESGLHVRVEANDAERREIARIAGLRDLPKLTAEFELMMIAGGQIRVVGQVNAVVGQTCVVTLEPLENTVEEPISLVFAPPSAIPDIADQDDGDDEPSDDPPEPIANGRIDLAKLAVEFLILGIDPYPRKAGAAFEPVHTPPSPEDHPFAGLAALKEPGTGSEPAKPPRKRS
jgi:uncharacterized metal-binding protein YceD (DUF177 family)